MRQQASTMLDGLWRMTWRDRALTLAAWPLLGICTVLLKTVEFRRLSLLLGGPVGAVGCTPLLTPREEVRARAIRRAMRRAARISPWRSDCLPQALGAAMLCRALSVPVATHLGVRLDGAKPLEAHAWTCSGRVQVTGGDGFSHWTPVQCFLAPRAAQMQR